jgi:uncharacterized protein YciI
MWCIAICHDVQGGGAARSASFQAHVEHNLKHMGAFLFTGPTASADGASGVGDDPRLRGSLYCMDVKNLSAARAIMEIDPFMNGAWRQIDYYEWRTPAGAWSSDAARPKGLSDGFRCYVAVSQAPLTIDDALMNGEVVPAGTTGAQAAPLRSIALLRAENMQEAVRHAAGADWVASVPVAIGRWVRISSPADLPARPS